MKDDESRSGTNYIDDENEYDDHVLYIHRLTLFCHHIILGRIGAFLRIPQSVRNNAALSKLSTMTMPSQSAGAALTSIREESKSNLTNGNSNTFNEFQQQQQKQQQQQQQEQDNDKDNYDEQKEADDITPSENNDNDTDNDNDKRVQKQVQFDSSDLIKAHDQGSNSSINSTVVLKNSESNDNHSVASYASSSMSYLEYNKMTCLDLFQLQWQEIMTSNLLGDASAMEMNVSAISHASHTSLSQGSNSDDSINNDNVQKQIGAKSMDRAHSALSQNSHISQHSQTDSTATGTGSGTMTTGSSGASDSIATPVPNSNAGSGNILVSPPFPNLTPTTPRSELGISPQSPYNKPPVESLNLLGLTQQKSRIGIEMTFRRIYFIYLTNFINRLWNDYHSNETSHYSKKKQRHNNSDESKDEAKDEAKEDKNKEKAKENNVNNNDNENLEEKEFVDTTSAMIDELVKLSGIDDCSPVFYKIAHFSLQLGKVVLDDCMLYCLLFFFSFVLNIHVHCANTFFVCFFFLMYLCVFCLFVFFFEIMEMKWSASMGVCILTQLMIYVFYFQY